MSLYTSDITRIDWNDVVAFCQERIQENATLDYKENFPARLENSIAAMANSFGGLILIGVAEDNDSRPICPPAGIPFERGLPERVTNILATNITPPVFPDVAVCTTEVGNRALLVLRVPQSHMAPHAVRHNTRVYVRTGNINQPEKVANLDQLHWLTNQRAQSEKLRMTLYEDADQRFDALITGLVPGIDMPDEAVVPTPRAAYLPAQLTLSACPVYPKEPLTSPPELMRLSREVRVGDYYGTAYFFPLPDTGHRLVGDGIALHSPGKPNLRTYHTQLNVYGLYLYRQSLLHLSDEDERDGEAPTVRFSEILARSDQFLESANRFFRELSYFGPLEIRLQLEHALQQGLRPVSYEFGHLRPGNPRFSTENAISLTRRISDQEIVDQRDALLLHFAERVAWMFGCEITEAELQRVYGDLGRRAAPV